MLEWAFPLMAIVAGIVSFSSPCTLPLIPGYVSYITALPVSEIEGGAARSVALRASLMFVAGFTVVFTALGASFALIGSVLLRNVDTITRIAGVGIILMGMSMLGLLRIPGLGRERRVDLRRIARGPGSASLLGMAFAVGWTPCIGPILASILAVAGSSQSAAWGASLLALYSLGLGVPFVLTAVYFQRAQRSISWVKRHSRRIERAGGATLTLVGVMFVSGAWSAIFIPLQRFFARLGWPPI